MRPSFSAFDHSIIAVKVIGLSHSPAIMVLRPASMRLAMAISPSRTEQLDRAHFAQIHAHRVIGAIERRLDDSGGRRRAQVAFHRFRLVLVIFGTRGFGAVIGGLVILDDVDAHFADSEDMTSSICSDDIWSCGRASFSSS